MYAPAPSFSPAQPSSYQSQAIPRQQMQAPAAYGPSYAVSREALAPQQQPHGYQGPPASMQYGPGYMGQQQYQPQWQQPTPAAAPVLYAPAYASPMSSPRDYQQQQQQQSRYAQAPLASSMYAPAYASNSIPSPRNTQYAPPQFTPSPQSYSSRQPALAPALYAPAYASPMSSPRDAPRSAQMLPHHGPSSGPSSGPYSSPRYNGQPPSFNTAPSPALQDAPFSPTIIPRTGTGGSPLVQQQQQQQKASAVPVFGAELSTPDYNFWNKQGLHGTGTDEMKQKDRYRSHLHPQ